MNVSASAGTSAYFIQLNSISKSNTEESLKMISLNLKYSIFSLVLLAALAGCASAQWSPGGQMAYMGELNLALPSPSQSSSPTANSSAPYDSPANNSSINMSQVNQTISNLPATGVSGEQTHINLSAAGSSVSSGEQTSSNVLDLSGYSRDRADKNMTGYKNIMYPISGSRGTTTSTVGTGGCGCG